MLGVLDMITKIILPIVLTNKVIFTQKLLMETKYWTSTLKSFFSKI